MKNTKKSKPTVSPFLVEARAARWLGKKLRRYGNTVQATAGPLKASCFPSNYSRTTGWCVCMYVRYGNDYTYITSVKKKKLQDALDHLQEGLRSWHNHMGSALQGPG